MGVEMMHGNGNQEVQYNSTGKDSDSWDRWYSRVINLITRYNISMWCYINCDWDSQPMWQGIGFGDTRISSSNYIMDRWREAIYFSDDEGSNNNNFYCSCCYFCCYYCLFSPKTTKETKG